MIVSLYGFFMFVGFCIVLCYIYYLSFVLSFLHVALGGN